MYLSSCLLKISRAPHEAHLDIVRSSPSIVEWRSIGANPELIGSFERPQCIGEDHVPKEEGDYGSQYERFRMELVEKIWTEMW